MTNIRECIILYCRKGFQYPEAYNQKDTLRDKNTTTKTKNTCLTCLALLKKIVFFKGILK